MTGTGRLLLILLSLALCWIQGTVVASAAGDNFRVSGSGTISENVGSVSESGSAMGTLIGSGRFDGRFTAGFPAPCPSTSSTVRGRLELTAANGDSLMEQLSGTYCQSATDPPTTASTATYVIRGGTGRFQYATGHGSTTSLSVFSTGNFPTTSSGPTTLVERGTIELNSPSARLAATPVRCVQGDLTAQVTGHGIASVKWSLNGRPIKGHTERSQTRYAAPVKLSPGLHRLTAKVTFVASSHVRARTFHRTVLGCSPAPPPFTG